MFNFIFKERFNWFDIAMIPVVANLFSNEYWVTGVIVAIISGAFSARMTHEVKE